MAEREAHRPAKRQRLNGPDGFQKPATKPKKISAPTFESAFASESASSSSALTFKTPIKGNKIALTSIRKPQVPPSSPNASPKTKRKSGLELGRLRTPQIASKRASVQPPPSPQFPEITMNKPVSTLKYLAPPPLPDPPPQSNLTPRKPVSDIKHPSLILPQPDSRRGVKNSGLELGGLRIPQIASKRAAVHSPAPPHFSEITPKKPVSTLKYLAPLPLSDPPPQSNLTTRKPVSEIKHPPPVLPQQDSRRGVKSISKTRIATSMDLDTEDGNIELSSLLIQQHYPNIGVSHTDQQLLRGLEISPQKPSSSVNRSTGHAQKFIHGGLADQANTVLSRTETADSLWRSQIQSLKQRPKPDMCISILDVLPTGSSRSVLVRCLVLGDEREASVLLFRTADVQIRKGQEVHVWQPWTSAGDILFCTRFVVRS